MKEKHDLKLKFGAVCHVSIQNKVILDNFVTKD